MPPGREGYPALEPAGMPAWVQAGIVRPVYSGLAVSMRTRTVTLLLKDVCSGMLAGRIQA